MDRIENCKQKFAELFGGKPTENEGDDPEFMRILQRFIFGEVCYEGSLDNRMRTGLTPQEIREAVYQCAPFIGFPKTLNAIAAMDEVFKERGIALPLGSGETITEADRYERGLALQAPIYGTEISERYGWLPAGFAESVPRYLTELCFSDFMTRKFLDGKTRELLTVVMLAAMGGAEVQVRSHAEGALKAGNTKEEVVCALVHAMPYMGIPRLFNALNCSKDVLS